jgi:ATP-binding cassette subfamily B protein
MFGHSEAPGQPIPKERRNQTIRRIAGFFRPYRPQVAIVFVAIIVTSLLGLINPLLLGALFDQVLVGQDYTNLGLFVGLMIVIPIVTGLIGVGQAYLNNVVGQNVMQDLRNALYAHLQRMPLRFFTETRTGEIQSRLANDVGGVQAVVTDTAASLTSNFAVAISTVIAMFIISWQLTLLSLGMMPFFLYLTYRVGKVRRTVSTETQKSLADLSAATEETLSVSGILLSKTFGQQQASIARFRDLNRRLAALQIRQAMVGRWFFMIIGTIFSITPAFVYWLAATLAQNGNPDAPSPGAVVAFTTLQSRLFFPLGALLNVQVEIQGSLALFDRIFEYLDLEPGIVDAADAAVLDPATVQGRVELRDVSFAYPPPPARPVATGADEADGLERSAVARTAGGDAERVDEAEETGIAAIQAGDVADAATLAVEVADERAAQRAALDAIGGGPAVDQPAEPSEATESTGPGGSGEPGSTGFALRGISFEAAPGELVALVGPSGSGKTTTTYLIPRLYDVDDGAILIDGHDLRSVSLESLGKVIGFVTQETYLFHSSIRDNLRYAKPDATDDELETAARAAAIHDRIIEFPDGYETIVGERGYKLSGGEKQRIAIARVLLKDPRILILDEATSALDSVSERLIQAGLERLVEGRTTIAIAHRLSTILRADRILVYERGTIVERGTHPELLAQGGLYANLYREQFLSDHPVDLEPVLT